MRQFSCKQSLVLCVFAIFILLKVQPSFAVYRAPERAQAIEKYRARQLLFDSALLRPGPSSGLPSEEERIRMRQIEVTTARFSPNFNVKALAGPRGVDATEVGLESTVTFTLERLAVQTRLSELFVKQGQALGAPPMKASRAAGPKDRRAKTKYRDLAVQGIDTIVEPAVLEIKASIARKERHGEEKLVSWMLRPRVRLVQTKNGHTVFNRTDYLGLRGLHTATHWVAEDAAVLRHAVEQALDAYARKMITEIFLIYELPELSWSYGFAKGGYGLRPEHPRHPFFRKEERSYSLKPKFRWEAFPTDTIVKLYPNLVTRISNVTYEFKLSGPGVTYERAALATNAHRLEIKLKPDTIYWWTVRARFEVDGQSRVTVWGKSDLNPYEFRTPS